MKPELKDIIYDWLKDGNIIDPFTALYYFDCDNLDPVILDIQNTILSDNETIQRKMVCIGNQKEYAQYQLIK